MPKLALLYLCTPRRIFIDSADRSISARAPPDPDPRARTFFEARPSSFDMVTADVSETEALRARVEALTAQVESLEDDAQTERVRFLAVERGSGADLAGKPESEIVAKLENDNGEMYHELQTTKAKDHALHLKVRALEEEVASERAKAAEAAKSHAGALESVTPRVTSSGRPTKQAFRDAVEVIDAHARGDAAAAVEATADALASLRRDDFASAEVLLRRTIVKIRDDARDLIAGRKSTGSTGVGPTRELHDTMRCSRSTVGGETARSRARDDSARGRRRRRLRRRGHLGGPRSLAGHADGVRGREEGDKRGG